MAPPAGCFSDGLGDPDGLDVPSGLLNVAWKGFKGLSTQNDFPLESMVSTHSISFTVPFLVKGNLGMAALT